MTVGELMSILREQDESDPVVASFYDVDGDLFVDVVACEGDGKVVMYLEKV